MLKRKTRSSDVIDSSDASPYASKSYAAKKRAVLCGSSMTVQEKLTSNQVETFQMDAGSGSWVPDTAAAMAEERRVENANPRGSCSSLREGYVAVIPVVVHTINRGTALEAKYRTVQEELQSLPVSPELMTFREEFRLVSQKVIDYNDRVIGRLKSSASDPDPIKVIAALTALETFNSRPNRVERVVDELHLDIMKWQRLAERVYQAHQRNDLNHRSLQAARENQEKLILARREYVYFLSAAGLRDLSEEEATQQVTLELQINRYEAEVERAELIDATPSGLVDSKRECLDGIIEETQKQEARKEAVELYRRAHGFYVKASRILNEEDDNIASYLKFVRCSSAADDLFRAAREAQKPAPNKVVIDLYQEASGCYDRACSGMEVGNIESARRYHERAGDLLRNAAHQAEKEFPNGGIIYFYQRASIFYQRAATAVQEGKETVAGYHSRAGDALLNAANETWKVFPDIEVIDFYQRASIFYQQAATTEQEGKKTVARYHSRAGDAFWDAAEAEDEFRTDALWNAAEAEDEFRNEEVIDWYHNASLYYEQAADAQEDGRETSARYHDRAGEALFSAAAEARKESPNEEVIDQFRRTSLFYEQAAVKQQEGKKTVAKYNSRTGDALWNAVAEAKRESPNKEVVEWYQRASIFHQQAAVAQQEEKETLARYHDSAGHSLFSAAQEAAMESPKKKVIDLYRRASVFYQQAAVADQEGKEPLARYHNRAGNALFSAVGEARKEYPNEEVIDLYERASHFHHKAAVAELEEKEILAVYHYRAGFSLFKAAGEARKESPNKEVIEWYKRASLFHHKAAVAEQEGKKLLAEYHSRVGNALKTAAVRGRKHSSIKEIIDFCEKAFPFLFEQQLHDEKARKS